MPYIPHTAEETQQMLQHIGVKTLEDLFADIPASMRPQSFDLPKGMSEMDVCAYMEGLAVKNRTDCIHFLGAGFYDHAIPSAIDTLAGRSEFYTAYTPYQPECSQGTLQAIFEYQTAVTRLMEMDCANASVYDGGSALFEAIMMSLRHTKRKTIIIDEAVNPLWRVMVVSYCSNLDMTFVTVPQRQGRSDMQALRAAVNDHCAAVVVQTPNFFGAIEDFTALFAHARGHKALSIVSVYPIMQAVLKTPGEMGADVAVADGQSLGMPLAFGGPYLGIMTCRKELIRQFPGRIAGRTHDVDGKTGYVLTLQAREQHIRRAKATSNICSNQALCALRSLMYMSLLGPEGLTRVATLSMERVRYAVERLTALPGVSLLHDAPYGNEVAVCLPIPAMLALDALAPQGCIPGFPLGRYYPDMENALLLACTERTLPEHIDTMVNMLGGVL